MKTNKQNTNPKPANSFRERGQKYDYSSLLCAVPVVQAVLINDLPYIGSTSVTTPVFFYLISKA